MLSMTGYATGYEETDGAKIAVEVRTVNHRFLDPHIRLPREYQFLEQEVQQAVRAAIRRGRVDMSISVQAAKPTELSLDLPVAKGYAAAAARLQQELGLADPIDLKTLLVLPGVLQAADAGPGSARPPQEVTSAVLRCVKSAMSAVADMRGREGMALRSEMLRHLNCVRDRVASMRALAPRLVLECRSKLEEHVARIAGQTPVDPQRLAQEVALLAEKSDFSEELARLDSHVEHFRELLDGDEVGKKMDFLLQEMQREANTVLSKCSSLEVAQTGIGVKADIEKLREQCQNIE
jgi:uncharacterized protein (TIGR00255 family)